MAKKAQPVILSGNETRSLKYLLTRGTASARTLSRARILDLLHRRQRPSEIALLKSLKLLGIETPAEALWLSGLKCVAAIAVAGVSWQLFEKPLLRFKDYFMSAKHPMPAATSAEPAPEAQVDLPIGLEPAD